MRELLVCLQGWLAKNRADGSAYSLLSALTSETLKRADSVDPGQREFDAETLAIAAGGPADFDAAKRWIDRCRFERFAEARRSAVEQHFRAAGHAQALSVEFHAILTRHFHPILTHPYSSRAGSRCG